MVEPVFHVALRYPVSGGLNDGFLGLTGTGRGTAVAAGVGQVGARFVHKHETSTVFFLRDFYEPAAAWRFFVPGSAHVTATRSHKLCEYAFMSECTAELRTLTPEFL